MSIHTAAFPSVSDTQMINFFLFIKCNSAQMDPWISIVHYQTITFTFTLAYIYVYDTLAKHLKVIELNWGISLGFDSVDV